MSYNPVEEMTREEIKLLIAVDLSQRAWGERDFYAEAEQILTRLGCPAQAEAEQTEPA